MKLGAGKIVPVLRQCKEYILNKGMLSSLKKNILSSPATRIFELPSVCSKLSQMHYYPIGVRCRSAGLFHLFTAFPVTYLKIHPVHKASFQKRKKKSSLIFLIAKVPKKFEKLPFKKFKIVKKKIYIYC